MALPPITRPRRRPLGRRAPALAAALTAVLVLVLAGCSGDDDPEPEGAPLTPPPTGEQVQAAVDADPQAEVGEGLFPPLGLIARGGSLSGVEQSCVRDYGYTGDDLCVLGDPAAGRTVVLWGDSRAAMWIPALSLLGQQQGFRVVVATKLGCAPLLGVTPWLEAESRPYTECAEWNRQVPDLVASVDPELVVVTGAVRGFAVSDDGVRRPLGESRPDNSWVPDPREDRRWQSGLARTLDVLGEDHATDVVVLGEAPYPTEDPGTCLAAHPDDATRCAVSREVGVYADHDAAVRATAEDAGARYVPVLPWTCGEQTCPAVVDDRVVYRDTFHLNREYVLWISRALGTALRLDGAGAQQG